MEKEKLINLVRPNQILWKKSSSEFLQAGKKADLWIAIAQEYPDSVSGIKLVLFYNKGRIPHVVFAAKDCRTKWQDMKDYFSND